MNKFLIPVIASILILGTASVLLIPINAQEAHATADYFIYMSCKNPSTTYAFQIEFLDLRPNEITSAFCSEGFEKRFLPLSLRFDDDKPEGQIVMRILTPNHIGDVICSQGPQEIKPFQSLTCDGIDGDKLIFKMIVPQRS